MRGTHNTPLQKAAARIKDEATGESINATEKGLARAPVDQVIERGGVEGDLLTSRFGHIYYVLQHYFSLHSA